MGRPVPTEGPAREAASQPDDGIDLAPACLVVERYVEAGALPCAVFGTIDAAGRTSVRSVGPGAMPLGSDAIFFLASITKAIVATAVMQYVDEGRLELRAPLARFLPELEGGRRSEVSAWHVLTHTSGLPDLHIETLRSERPSYERSLAFALSSEPMWEPGSRYEYVSAPWLLLAETIARLSGTSYDGALRMRLTRPLGMHDTSFDPRRDRGRVVPVHGFRIDNRIVQEVLLRFLVRARLPGGGMFGTVRDLLRFGRALLPRHGDATGPRILSTAAIAEMTRNHTEGMTVTLEDGEVRPVRQAIGWRKPLPGWPGDPSAFTHAGISGGRLWVDPSAGFAFAFLTNQWQAPDEPALDTLRQVYRSLDA